LNEPKNYRAIMLSSTFTDLKEHRQKAIEAIQKFGYPANVLEYGGAAADADVIRSSLNMVRDSAAYIGVIGLRYGQTPLDPDRNPDRLSNTELEFNEAMRLNRPIALFIMSDKHLVTRADVESDPDKRRKLDAFRERAKLMLVGSEVARMYEVFDSLEQFAKVAPVAVERLAEHLFRQPPNRHISKRPHITLDPAGRKTSSSERCAIILTALETETRAVLRHLREIHEQVVRGTVFHVGQFEEWNVAVAECGEGNIRAATIVERAIERFRPDVSLFVGVAGGVKDVSIGDVLVANKVYGYERGKDTARAFKPRPAVILAAHPLEQRARAIRLREHWRTRLNPKVPHQSPAIYIGAIAAGEKVVASSRGQIAKFLKRYYGDTLGVEMEAYGFLDGVHINAPVYGCVIRGISDLLDGKVAADKAGSQDRAADAASAATFEILATLDLSET
jgi:nucleoside phosphorylase